MPRKVFFFLLIIGCLLFVQGASAGELIPIGGDFYLEPAPEPTPPPAVEPPAAAEPTPIKTPPATPKTSPAPKPSPNVMAPTPPTATNTPETDVSQPAVAAAAAPPANYPQIIVKNIAAATADNNIVKNLPAPRSVEFTAASAKRQINLSLWLFFLVGLSATVINEAVKKFNESPNRLRAWWKNKIGNRGDFFIRHPFVRKLLVLLALLGYGALIVMAEAPATLASGLATLAPVLIAATIFLLIKEGGEKIWLARGGAESLLIFSGAGLVILLVGVILSRGVNLLPPLLLSAPIILISANAIHKNEVSAKSKTIALTLAVLAAFWFSAYINNSVWQGAVLLVCAVGIQDLFFSLIPINPLPGHVIFKTSFRTWLILSVLTTLGFVFMILGPNSATSALNVPWTSAAIYAGAALIIWLSLKMSGRQTTKQR